MKINIAALAVLATTAAAVPLGAVNAIGSHVTNATGPAAAPNGSHPFEPCVMPSGCRDDKHDKHFIVPTKATTRTFSVPTETSSRSRGDAWLPVPPKTTKTSSIETGFSWLLPVPTKTSGVITDSP